MQGLVGLRQGRAAIQRQWLLDVSRLTPLQAQSWHAFLAAAAAALGLEVQLKDFSGNVPEDGAAFAFVSSSAALSRKLLWNLPRIYIAPNAAPYQVDPWLLWKINAISSQRIQAKHQVSVISSVFRGDEFLSGFLRNCSQWHGYAQMEHFLIRPNSPGQEHAALLAHVRQWPSAIYLYLPKDPGLYPVWNLGTQLATGAFLTNANLDDQRAPEQIAVLAAALQDQSEISAVAAVLRISETPGLAWEDSQHCSTIFSNIPTGLYRGKDLFRNIQGRLLSRNFLHCMPLWRRSLHNQFGFFNEKHYGPSADWAFWLVCAAGGAQFGFVNKILGLYLRDQRSYWHRNPSTVEVDTLIAQQYGWMTRKGEATAAIEKEIKPLSLQMGMACALLDGGVMLQGLAQIIQVKNNSSTTTVDLVLEKISKNYLGGLDIKKIQKDISIFQESDPIDYNKKYLFLVVTFLHEYKYKNKHPSGRALRFLEWICCDLIEIEPVQGKILLAFLFRLLGDKQQERLMLSYAYKENAQVFWQSLQTVYRFTRLLQSVMQDVGWSELPAESQVPEQQRILYFPDFSANTYLNLLYAPLKQAGDEVIGFKNINDFLSQKPLLGKKNVLHIHWIQNLVNDVAIVDGRQVSIISRLEDLKKLGFRLHWTIHNKLSHECKDEDVERYFRQNLYKIADKVYVHHPLAINFLDWLPDNKKIVIHEHGRNLVPYFDNEEKSSFKQSLGLKDEDFVITIIGLMRDYKGVDDLLPKLLHLLNENKRIKIILAGQQSSRKIHAWLSENPHPAIIIVNEYLSEKKLALHMAISDVGLVPYRSVLTSGSLFHWLSAGRLVVAPGIGLIPAHLVDGWNGRSYSDNSHLIRILKHLASMKRSDLMPLHVNASQTAKYLDWKIFE